MIKISEYAFVVFCVYVVFWTIQRWTGCLQTAGALGLFYITVITTYQEYLFSASIHFPEEKAMVERAEGKNTD